MNTKDLKQLAPCESGYKFAQSKNSLIEAWNTCERGDWMLWFAMKLDCPVELLTLAKGKCAETVLHLMCDERSRNAVKVAIDFGNGVASREELHAAADAANAAAACAADAYNAAYAAYNAANADATANATANTADFASDAAYYAAYNAANADYAAACDASASYSDAYADAAAADAADAAADAAKKENQQQTANICRDILSEFIKSKL